MTADTETVDDAALVARCIAGDGTAWTALVHRYQRLVYAIVRRIGMDEHAAADVFQTVFTRLIEHLPRIAEPSRLQAWIITTAKREALLQRSRGQRECYERRRARGRACRWLRDCGEDGYRQRESQTALHGPDCTERFAA